MTLLVIGCGKMGGAMLEGWLEQGTSPESVYIIEHSTERAHELRERFGVQAFTAFDQLPDGFSPDVVLLAVKPQVMDQALSACHDLTGAPTFLSVAAGKTISYFESHLGTSAKIVRVMPNTPAAIRRGISAAFANQNVSAAERATCQTLLEAIGEVCWLKDESQMDAVTAVSGSGPAYVFYVTECMTQAGIKAGLPEELAKQLARATVAGAGELMRQTGIEAGTLRENVTSPNGTTQAALEVLMAETGISAVFERAIDAAAHRSKELAG